MIKKICFICFLSLILSGCQTPRTIVTRMEYEHTKINLEKHRIDHELYKLRISGFTFQYLYDYLTLLNVPHKEIILRQAILETGHFTSEQYLLSNNLFGMKLPRLRETTAISSHKGYSRYTHWTQSVDDYLILQEYWRTHHKIFYVDGYEMLREAGYAEDPRYIEILQEINLNQYVRTSNREDSSIRN